MKGNDVFREGSDIESMFNSGREKGRTMDGSKGVYHRESMPGKGRTSQPVEAGTHERKKAPFKGDRV